MWGLAILAMATAANGAPGVEDVVRRQRADYNGAIVSRDLGSIEALLTPDYVVLPGSKGTPQSKAELMSLFASAFGDAGFDRYVRSPDRIELSSSSRRVSETGRWTGVWRKADGVMTVSGIYQAMWVPHAGGWKLRNESFVTLHCTGSQECAAVD